MKYMIYLFLPILLLTSCEKNVKSADEHALEENDGSLEYIHLTSRQMQALKIKMDTLKHRDMGISVEANGQLKVPPQNEAIITSIMGANIHKIEVGQGDEVKKGQVLAFLSHPDMIGLQSEYRKNYDEMSFLEKEFNRQKRLYEEGVAAGMVFQQAEKQYLSAKEHARGLEAKLRMLNLNPQAILNGKIFEQIPVLSPIAGFVQEIHIRTGQFVEPQSAMFEVIDPKEVYADLKVYEKDAQGISEGQLVNLNISSKDEDVLAKVYSVGKSFESQSRAIHVLAEIENKELQFFPGTYVKARIRSERNSVLAFPEEAIVEVEDKSYVFIGISEENGDWKFSAEEIKIQGTEDQWVSIQFLRDIPENTLFAYNNAYYLLAETQKGLGGHDH